MGIFAASGFWLIRHEVHLIHVGIGDSHNRFECNDASRTFLHRSGANDEDGASGKLGLSMFDVKGGAKAVNDKSDQDKSRAGIDEYIVVCSHKHKFFVLNKRPLSFEFFDIFDRESSWYIEAVLSQMVPIVTCNEAWQYLFCRETIS